MTQTLESPLVTIVIPTIGRPAYVLATLDCALAQDHSPLEILVSDNRPDTPTRDLIGARALDPRLRIVERGERLPYIDHFMACLRDARGEYLMFLSDDDLVDADYVSAMVAPFVADGRVSVAVSRQIAIGATSEPALVASRGRQTRIFEGADYVWTMFRRPHHLPILTYVSLFARRKDFLEVGFRDYPDGSHADNFLMLSLALKGRVALADSAFYYRVYAGSSGLSTGFRRLLLASQAYEEDVGRLLRRRADRIWSFRTLCVRLGLRLANINMLANRLIRVYRKRMSRAELATAALQVLGFAAGWRFNSPGAAGGGSNAQN